MNLSKSHGRILVIICILIIFIAFISLVLSKSNPFRILSIMGYRPMIITTGSMKPDLYPGDMIISMKVKPEQIKEGDIITYHVKDSIPITHRVTAVIEREGEWIFRTKGDANAAEDSRWVESEQVIGRMVCSIPKLGYVSQYIKTKRGFSLTILLPLILAMIIGFLSILNEIKQYKKG